MAKNVKKKRKLKKGLIKRFIQYLKYKSEEAARASRVLLVLLLLSVIAWIGIFYLYQPAKEIYVAESTFVEETRSIYDFKEGSNKREEKIKKAEESAKVYEKVMNKYTQDSNAMIKGYAKIHSNFIKGIIAILLILPYFSIVIMFIGGPVKFMFALANIILVYPVKVIIFLFNLCREKKDKKAPSLKIKNQEN